MLLLLLQLLSGGSVAYRHRVRAVEAVDEAVASREEGDDPEEEEEATEEEPEEELEVEGDEAEASIPNNNAEASEQISFVERLKKNFSVEVS